MMLYSGIFLENYKTCAEIKEDKVIFIKAKEEKHRVNELYLETVPKQAFSWAITAIARTYPDLLNELTKIPLKNLPQTPIVIAGNTKHSKLKKDAITKYNMIPAHQPFYLEKIWLPKEEAMEETYPILKLYFKELYYTTSPLELLISTTK